MKMKILTITIVTLFFGTIFLPNISSISIKELESNDNTLCYGFIIPLVKIGNKTLENEIDCRINHMINDFLREEISVYWAAQNFSATIIKIDKSTDETMFFEKGTFIVPFTENDTINTKICAIVCDYNQTSEIEEAVKIPTYQLLESIDIKAHELKETKIARYAGARTHYTLFYMFVANDCGFLDFDLIHSTDIREKLTNENFDVFIWPGAELGKENVGYYYNKARLEEYSNRVMPVIRNFVANGGAHLSSCYGTTKSSILYIYKDPDSLLRYRVLLPTLGIGGHFVLPRNTPNEHPINSIDDYFCNQTIINPNHPLAYGLGSIVRDFSSLHGLKVVGPNAQAVALYPDNSPCWIANIYNQGRVVSFGSHPEIASFLEEEFNGRHVMSNAWFYLTNKGIFDTNCEYGVNFSVIDNIFENSTIEIDGLCEKIFENIRQKINQSLLKLDDLESKILDLQLIVKQLDQEDEDIINMNKTLKRMIGGKLISGGISKSNEYLDSSIEHLDSIEQVYQCIQSNDEFLQKVQSFNDTMISKLEIINSLIDEAYKYTENAEQILNEYKDNNWLFPEKRKLGINEILYNGREKLTDSLVSISQLNNYALKFLRHNWYEYETQIEI